MTWERVRLCSSLRGVQVTKRAVKDFHAPPLQGVLIHGLFLQGALLHPTDQTLMPTTLDTVEQAVNVIHVKPVLSEKKEPRTVYDCPVYVTSNRGANEYIASFPLKSELPPRKWIVAGVALLLEQPF